MLKLTAEEHDRVYQALTAEAFETGKRFGLSSADKCVLATRMMFAFDRVLKEIDGDGDIS